MYYSTTAAINFITWNKVYSIFPDATFINRETYPLKLDHGAESSLIDYQRHGINPMQPSDNSRRVPKSLTWRRCLGDKYTWKMDLDIESLKYRPNIPDQILDYSEFTLRKYRDICRHEPSSCTSYLLSFMIGRMAPSLNHHILYGLTSKYWRLNFPNEDTWFEYLRRELGRYHFKESIAISFIEYATHIPEIYEAWAKLQFGGDEIPVEWICKRDEPSGSGSRIMRAMAVDIEVREVGVSRRYSG